MPEVLARVGFENDQIKTAVRQRLLGAEPLGETDSAVKLLAGITLSIAVKYFADQKINIGSDHYFSLTNRADFAPPPNPAAYKGRSLRGIFASAPYLHNGSVRTLEQLLLPPDQREKSFRVGSYRYDVAGVGYVSEGDYTFDTTQPGNSNAGHAGEKFGTELGDEDRQALLEFLKTL
jgi:hypothetical protein